MSFGFGMGFTRNDPFAGGPSLNLQFVGATSLDPAITFTRALNTATYFNSSGLLTTANANVARFDYDPAVPANTVGVERATSSPVNSSFVYIQPTSGSVATVNGETRVYSADGTLAQFQPASAFWVAALTVGKTYKVTFNITVVSGTALLQQGVSSTTYGSYTTSGSNTVYITALDVNTLFLFKRQGGVTDFTVSNISVQEVAFTPRGLLIEEARTNLILQSRDMTQAAWTKTDVTPNRNQVGLDGVANTATLLTEGSAGTAITSQDGAAVTAGSTITASFVVKRGNTDWIRVGATGGGFTNGADGWFNLATGAKGSVTARGTGTSNSSTITNLGGGWYRCAVTTVPDATYTVPKAFIVSASADNSGTRVANSTYIVDCAQLEVGAFATSIIPTTTTTLTRNADSAVMTGANFSSWYNQAEGTFAAEWVQPANSTTTVLHRVDDGTANNRIQLAILTSRTLQAVSSNSGVTTFAPLTANVFTFGAIVKSALAWDATGKTVCLNAGTVPNANNTNMPSATLTRLTLDNGGSVQINGHIRRITYYPRRLSNAELQAITS